jgi:hypothetical protein
MDLDRLKDLDSGPGKALLEATCQMGFSEPVARAGLEAELAAWQEPEALARLRLGAEASGVSQSNGPKTVLVIAAGTLPASTLRHVFLGRLMGARVILKSATGQEALGEALASADAMVESARFSRDDVAELRAAVDRVDTVVALGSDESLSAIEGHVPFHKTFVGYGHRVSALWLDELDDDVLLGAATDLLMWDQAGCLSPHVAWTSHSPKKVAAGLAEAVLSLEDKFPMTLTPWAARERHGPIVLGHMLGQVHETESAAIVAMPLAAFRPSPRHRLLWVLPASTAELRRIEPQLSALGVSGALDVRLGDHVRRCRPGQMQRPPLGWHQDGKDPLLSMMRSS